MQVIRRRSPTSLEKYVYMRDVQESKLIFLDLLDYSSVQEIFWNYRMWRTYPRSGEISYKYLFWIDFDIVFFLNWKS